MRQGKKNLTRKDFLKFARNAFLRVSLLMVYYIIIIFHFNILYSYLKFIIDFFVTDEYLLLVTES